MHEPPCALVIASTIASETHAAGGAGSRASARANRLGVDFVENGEVGLLRLLEQQEAIEGPLEALPLVQGDVDLRMANASRPA